MPFLACKLPSGLIIEHEGVTITLNGGSVGEDLEQVSKNGSPSDNALRASGYGLTEVSAAQADKFVDWSNVVTYKNGKKEDGKLAEPFKALENNSIVGPFKTIDEARKEVAALSEYVSTGFEGQPQRKAGIEPADKK